HRDDSRAWGRNWRSAAPGNSSELQSAENRFQAAFARRNRCYPEPISLQRSGRGTFIAWANVAMDSDRLRKALQRLVTVAMGAALVFVGYLAVGAKAGLGFQAPEGPVIGPGNIRGGFGEDPHPLPSQEAAAVLIHVGEAGLFHRL